MVTPSAVLAGLVVDALVSAGVTHVVLCPGSRNAPLGYALDARHRRGDRPELVVRHDERVAGFTALGIGKAGALGAVVTTSGTAAGNLLPAVLEAHHAGVPLVVVTADRPHVLRDTWANQTSSLQAGLYGGAVRVALDVAEVGQDPAPLRAALGAARGSDGRRPGPVHLNVGFSDPLVPE